LRHHVRGGVIVDFDDICIFPLMGRLEGGLRLGNGRRGSWKSSASGYTFVIPDRQELLSMFGRPVTG